MRIGKPEPGNANKMGATLQQGGTNFVFYTGSEAEGVDLCLYDNWHDEHRISIKDRVPVIQDGMTFGYKWHVYVPGVEAGDLYLQRVRGEHKPSEGKRYNWNKPILDMFGNAIVGGLIFDPAYHLLGHKPDSPDEADTRNSAPFMARNRVENMNEIYMLSGATTPGGHLGRLYHPANTTVLEMHVNAPMARYKTDGTFAALTDTNFVRDLRDKHGVKTILLQPIHPYDRNSGGTWGYSSVGYHTAHTDYARDRQNPDKEFVMMVRKLRDLGIEVIVDVVYNHTAEGDHRGPTFCWKGADNQGLYRLYDARYYLNPTGCGNSLNTDHPIVQEQILSSMDDLIAKGVAGLRFDLFLTLGRHHDGRFDENHALYQKVVEKAKNSVIKITVEGWDPEQSEETKMPAEVASWNGSYRDTVSQFAFSGHGGDPGKLFEAMLGYPDKYKSPLHSQNFVAIHDGHSLNDKVRHYDNLSHLSPDQAETIYQQRMQFAMLIEAMSHGIPMLRYGDPSGQSFAGSDNNWRASPVAHEPTDRQKQMMDAISRFFFFREEHPELTRETHVKFQPYPECPDGPKDAQVYNNRGEPTTFVENESQILSYTLGGRPMTDNHHITTIGKDVHVLINGSHDPQQVTLPKRNDGTEWTRELDSSYIYQSRDEKLPEWKLQNEDTTITIPPRTAYVFTGGKEREIRPQSLRKTKETHQADRDNRSPGVTG